MLGNERWGPEGEALGFLLRPKVPRPEVGYALSEVDHMESKSHVEVESLGFSDRSRTKQKLTADKTATEVQGWVGHAP